MRFDRPWPLALLFTTCLAGCSADLADETDEGLADEAALAAFDAEPRPQTACTALAHVGDSLSAYTLPRLEREYRAHGVETLELAAHGGRAILQRLRADPETGLAAAKRIKASGFSGCWVVALGTNDTANIAKGGGLRADAIDRMMRAIDPEKRTPVMWVDTFTMKTTGYWSNANMQLWNEALHDARGRWPNLRVFAWSETAATGRAPFNDGIHHTTAGYAVRNRAIADALATFFPAGDGIP